MVEQITTFREILDDESQLHESTNGVELIEIDNELLKQVGLVGERLNQDESSIDMKLGMSLWIPGSNALDKLPQPNSTDRSQPNACLFPIFDAFGKFLFLHKAEVFRGLKPSYIRVLAIGPNSNKLNSWHCDPLIERVGTYFTSRTPPNVGRIGVGLDGKLRENAGANIQFVDGGFIVQNVVQEHDRCRDWNDLYKDYADSATIVTRESGSMMLTSDRNFKPPQETVRTCDDLVLTKLGCTSLHTASSVSDSVRFSLQCQYDGFEKA